VNRLFRLFVFGIFLGVAGAGALAYSVPVVDLHREASHIAVRANGGNAETFHINLPDDRIMVGLAGADNALPAGLDWPGEATVGNLQAEIFKVRDRNDVVIGVASRLASASERTGRFIEWTLHLPARGTVYLKMDLAPTNQGYRNGTLIAGTREFDAMNGKVREQFVSNDKGAEFDGNGRIELVTVFVGSFARDPQVAASSGEAQ